MMQEKLLQLFCYIIIYWKFFNNSKGWQGAGGGE